MQISEKNITDTVDFVLNRFRRQSSEVSTEFLLDIDYYDARSELRGIRLLFLSAPVIFARINAAIDETDEIRTSAIRRLSSVCPVCGGLGTDVATGFLCADCAGTGK